MPPIDSEYPSWMQKYNPKPRQERRVFNNLEIVGWLGRAPVEILEPWVENPRIGDPVERWIDDNRGKRPNKDELLDIMFDNSVSPGGGAVDETTVDVANGSKDEDEKTADVRRSARNLLMDLVHNIELNEIRLPLVVTHDLRILDGNRRYFAAYYLFQNSDESDRRKYASVPVWVLPEGIEPGDEDHVLTELNAINDCYIPWPYSVMAKRIFEDKKSGLTDAELEIKYHNYTKSRIRQTVEAYRVATEFIEYYNNSPEAKAKVYGKLIWFDELARSNGKFMDKPDFKERIFDLILHPYSPFSRASQFKGLGEIYNNPEAWKELNTDGTKEALKKAQFIVDRDRFEGRGDAQSKVKRVNDLLTLVINGPGFGAVLEETLNTFHDLGDKVPHPGLNSTTRSLRLINLLDSLTSKEIASLSSDLSERLIQVIERVRKQSASSSQ